jgi:predicted RNase H-like HicB family nuclease
MKLEGNYKKDGKFWLSEIPFIQLMDQGKSKSDCLKMIKSAIEELINKPGFKCEVEDMGDGVFTLSSKDIGVLAGFVLRRLREANGLTVRDMAKRLHEKSHTTYARHESGESSVPMETFGRYVEAIAHKELVIKIA